MVVFLIMDFKRFLSGSWPLTTASPLPGGEEDTALARGCPSLPLPVTGAEVEPSLGSAFCSVGTRIVYSEEQNTQTN